MQMLVDIGFSPTFSRVIAYAMGGTSASNLKDFRNPNKKIQNSDQPNWETINRICSTMRAVYWRLTVILIFLLATLGTGALIKPISATANAMYAWIAWAVILITSTIVLRGNVYSAYLQGVNQIVVLRRVETFSSLGATFFSFLILVLGGGLLGLVIANQGCLAVNILQNRWLCNFIHDGRFRQFRDNSIDRDVFEAVWPSAWRSGLGVFMASGFVQASGVIYAQVGSAAGVASYLLALRLIQTVSQFSQAPFYSKLPVLARLRSEGKLDEQVRLAQRGMSLAYWAYVAGFVGLGFLAQPLLTLIGSNAKFATPLLWSLMGIGFFIERYGAMHIQLYSTTNHIIWHTANGVSGIICILVSLVLFNQVGVYAFPIAVIVGYLSFYSWYSAWHSYRAYNLNFLEFERYTMFPPLTLVLVSVAILNLINYL